VSKPPTNSFNYRLEFPPELPITDRVEEIVATIEAHQVVVLAGETGSGKTTQIPKMCLAAGRGIKGRIACTQPRRVAALSVSKRVAEELRVGWGREVGCKIRFNDQTSSATAIKFLTDGMLLAEMHGDPMLREYDTIIIDEAHERSLNIDFLLGHLRQLRFRRPDLKIIITSATIDTEAFSKAFDDAPIIQVSGRTYPVEVIYAPLDELGSDAAEGDERASRSEALHYIDGAIETVQRVVNESSSGDVLVFMPSERDIRETCDVLAGRKLRNCELVPLYGRLSNPEQQRVFATTQQRKIVVATNIAETSLTIPGVRFVIDTGLARVSRYSPGTRTRRLPIEAVSQSSADQRKGRAGRVSAGVCVRLYAEKDFLERPRFTQPEIQRANLADVILRMKAFGLGDIERFPFLNMPAAKAIRSGYELLEELGALAEERDGPRGELASGRVRELTEIGRELARLPVDPAVGRMILQARREQALREVLVIAAGLSIQDPRERPLEKQVQADAAHRRFLHPDSDFLTMLNIWDAYHEEFEAMTQSKLRRFCRDHFLSYTRMREWRDIHAQLFDVVKEGDKSAVSSALAGIKEVDLKTTAFGTPAFRAIHRSILAGLLGNIAQLDEESGLYKATHDRKVALFPGSVLFRRDEPRKRKPEAAPRPSTKKSGKGPRWLMVAEIMETTRLFARTCARLDPQWAVELGSHLLKVSHSEPFWDGEKGRVMVKQRSRLYGLELESRAVSYGKVNPADATEIFIREGLVNDTISWPFDFIAHNRAVRQKFESVLTRTRDSGYLNLDEAIYRFYAERLIDGNGAAAWPTKRGEGPASPRVAISSVAELGDLVRERKGADPQFLEMQEADLRDPATLVQDPLEFPEALPLLNRALPLHYAYRPGQTDDGVTLTVSVREAQTLTTAALEWAVPGHLVAKVEHYLRALPKELRRAFVPMAETAKRVAERVAARDRLTDRRETLPEALAAQLHEQFGLRVTLAMWAMKSLPDHLQVRVQVLDDDGQELCASRELEEIRKVLGLRLQEASEGVARADPKAWQEARTKWEKGDQTSWTFGDIPVQVLVTEQAGVPVWAFPGIKEGVAGVALRLFKTSGEALETTRQGVAALLELQLRHDLGWLEKDLKALHSLGTLAATLVAMPELQQQAYEMLDRWACDPDRMVRFDTVTVSEAAKPYLRETRFAAALVSAKDDLRGIVPRLVDTLTEILTLRQHLQVHATPYAELADDLASLVPTDFLRRVPYRQLGHLARYLRAMKVRADRWRQNQVKDADRAQQLAPYLKAGRELADADAGGRLRWLVEEYRVSVFAQELGTAEPVSAKKLDRMIAELKGGDAAVNREPVEPAPVRVAPTVSTTRTAPVKSLGALDKLFRR